MSMYGGGHRGMGAVPPSNGVGRLTELLDQIRTEFETQMRASENYEHQIQAQVNEMQLIREKVYTMEQTHMNLKQKYEEEIAVLRRQLGERGGPSQGHMGGPQQHGGPPQPPSLGMGRPDWSCAAAASPGAAPLNTRCSSSRRQASRAPPPPPPPPPSQQNPFGQQGYGQPPAPGGFQSQPPPTNSPGPVKRPIGRPPPGGPATPQINTPVPYPGPNQSPQVASHPTPDHARMQMAPAGHSNNSLGDLDPERLPAHYKKTRDDWFVIFNQQVPRVIDVDLVHTLQHESVVCCVRFSVDGKYVATGCNRSAQIYDVQTGEKLCVLQDEAVDTGGDLYIRSVCFSPDGKYLATGAEDKLIRVWDIQTRTIRNTFAGHEQDIYSLDFARDGRTIASGSGDRTVRLWDIENGQSILTLTIEDGVTTVAISPDTKYVAAGSLDKSVRVWDIQQGYLVERLEGPDGHKDSVYSVAFSPNGKDLVSGSLDKTIKMWELAAPRGISNQGPKGGRCVRTFEGHRDFVLSVALTPDAQWVLSGSKDRGVQFWDPRTGHTQLMLQGHKNSVISVAPSPTGGYFATGSGDMRARIWSYGRYHS
ncbi:glucose repression regulatory protein TUP1 [Sporothrix schenckii 1099-18]|uniref:Glucose repression regulatory protein TUP1 n=1 Tax=Sporothrix schenckii 1099-18 TaxID=1397361 RepID=A0A0F2M9G9_SPOSC|nr:glucose repression regulatory protein TUP1 [Sporothrix schenckii 1099-18]KJR86358.1 glucose repression regulatory protein TUP1 [Sporothrix schenckii 1099-18]